MRLRFPLFILFIATLCDALLFGAPQTGEPKSKAEWERELNAAEAALAAAKPGPSEAAAKARVARIVFELGQEERAEALFLSVIEGCRAHGLTQLEADTLHELGSVSNDAGNFDKAQGYYRQSLALSESIGHKPGMIKSLNGLAYISDSAGDRPSALRFLETAASIARDLGDKSSYSKMMLNLGRLYTKQGDHAKAQGCYELVMAIAQKDLAPAIPAYARMEMGRTLMLGGKATEALPYIESAVSLHRSLGPSRALVDSLLMLSSIFRLQGSLEKAAACLNEIDTVLPQVSSPEELPARTTKEKALLAAAGQRWEEAFKLHQKSVELQEADLKHMGRINPDPREVKLLIEKGVRTELLKQKTEESRRLELALEESNLRLTLLQWAGAAFILLVAAGGYLLRAKIRAEKREYEITLVARRNAEASAALKTRLLHMAAHDLRSPLTVVMASADTAMLGLEDNEMDRELEEELLGMIRGAAQQIKQLLDDLLQQVASEEGSLRVQPKPTEMAGYLGEIVQSFKYFLARKQQTITLLTKTDTQAHSPADPIKMWQVFDNLISNASKFSPAGSKIEVILECSETQVRCGVRDQGPGISAADRKHLFQAFARGEAKPTGGESSTGLGLSIVKEIVERHQGEIHVESTLGKGSTFWVVLPRCAPPQAA